MGLFNNIQRLATFDISEYIGNFQRQIQTVLKLDANNTLTFNKNALQMLEKELTMTMLLQNIKWKLGCQQNRIQLMFYCLMEEIT